MIPTTQLAHEIMIRARQLLPGGVSSPVRAYKAVGGEPPVIASARGAQIVDVDGNKYIDFVLSYGPHILGHGHRAVLEAIAAQLDRGIAFGATSELEVDLASRIVDAVASIDMVRFVNSGTEAAMSAVRLARGATGRDLIIKCSGGYHGHADALLAEAGSGVATLGLVGSPGIPTGAIADTAVVAYNDLDAVEQVLSAHPMRVAAVIVEPVAGNMGCVPPQPGYLAGLRALCSAHGALLIFDEVMTGFRVAYGGAQQLYGVSPDLTCLGKVIGGGLPVAAYGGRRELMEQLAPVGPVYQAGTLSGNPLAMAAGIAVLDVLASGDVYENLEKLGERMESGLREAVGDADSVNRVGSMLTLFLSAGRVREYASAKRADVERFSSLHRAWSAAGIFWPPSQFECGFLSSAHKIADIDLACEVTAAWHARQSVSVG